MRSPLRQTRQARPMSQLREVAPKRWSFEGDLGFRVRQLIFHWPYYNVFQRMRMFLDIMLFVKTDTERKSTRVSGQKGRNPKKELMLTLVPEHIEDFEKKFYGAANPEEWSVKGPNDLYETVHSTLGLMSLEEISIGVRNEATTAIKVSGWLRHPFSCEHFGEEGTHKIAACKIVKKREDGHPPQSCKACKYVDSLIPEDDVYIRECVSSRYYTYLHGIEREISKPYHKIMTEIYIFLRKTKVEVPPAQGDIGHFEEQARDDGKLDEAQPFDREWGIKRFDEIEGDQE